MKTSLCGIQNAKMTHQNAAFHVFPAFEMRIKKENELVIYQIVLKVLRMMMMTMMMVVVRCKKNVKIGY